jgi:hypothetical protein
MLMTQCKECSKEISSDAEVCPYCGIKRRRRSGKVILICLGLLVVCFVMINREDSNPLAGSGLTIGQQIVVSDTIPGCKSLESFKAYDANLLDQSDIDAYCPVVDGGTRLSVGNTTTIFPGMPEEKKVVDTVIESGPRKGQQFWCTVENLASVVKSSE